MKPIFEKLPKYENTSGWPWTEEPISLPSTMLDGSPWPKVSIVTPSYNQGKYIEETIRSVLLQGYPNLEYIIMDGGSTDKSVEIIKKYEPWLAFWVSEKDKGQSHAINKGWMRSTGDILAWLNSDDVFQPGVFAEVARLWVENKNIGFIHAQTEMVDGDGLPIGRLWGSPFDLKNSLTTSENCVAQQSTFISRDVIEKVGFLDETLEMSMDWDFWVRISAQYPVMYVPKIWSKIRIWENTKTSTIFELSGEDHLQIAKKITQNKGVKSISESMKHTALAAAYGRIARISYENGDFQKFRISYFQSFLANPVLLGGSARHLWVRFLLGQRMSKTLQNLKWKFLNFFKKKE